jgi:hypothetical protein
VASRRGINARSPHRRVLRIDGAGVALCDPDGLFEAVRRRRREAGRTSVDADVQMSRTTTSTRSDRELITWRWDGWGCQAGRRMAEPPFGACGRPKIWRRRGTSDRSGGPSRRRTVCATPLPIYASRWRLYGQACCCKPAPEAQEPSPPGSRLQPLAGPAPPATHLQPVHYNWLVLGLQQQ